MKVWNFAEFLSVPAKNNKLVFLPSLLYFHKLKIQTWYCSWYTLNLHPEIRRWPKTHDCGLAAHNPRVALSPIFKKHLKTWNSLSPEKNKEENKIIYLLNSESSERTQIHTEAHWASTACCWKLRSSTYCDQGQLPPGLPHVSTPTHTTDPAAYWFWLYFGDNHPKSTLMTTWSLVLIWPCRSRPLKTCSYNTSAHIHT